MSPFFSLFLFLLFCISNNETAKILFTFYHDRGSHFGSMLPLMEKLSQHNHSVFVLWTFSFQPPSVKTKNINIILSPIPEKENEDKFNAEYIWNKTVGNALEQVLIPVNMGGNKDMGQLLEIHQSKVVEIINSDWDLIIIDDLFWTFGFALTTLKHRLWEKNGRGGGGKETKSIVYSTAGQTLLSAEFIKSTGRDWVSKSPLFPFIPTDKNDAYTPRRFTHRLHALFENGAEYILMNWIVEQFLMPNIARFGVPNFTWKELYTRSSLQLSDSIDRLGWPLSKGPEMINIGAHCKNPGKMPEKFRKFIEEGNSEGTIYVAFGTYPEWSLAPKRIISALIGAFERLNKFKIIFAYNGPPIKNLNKNILLTKWAPQLEILAHPKTKAYITHGGLKSVREGLCSGVPLILMPLFAEQAHNAQQLLVMGIGPVINKYTLTVDSVYSTIYSTVSNSKNILISKRFRSIFLDRPIKALDEGLFWIERITRSKPGRKVYFERKGINLNWIEFLYFDFVIFVFIFILLVIF